MRYGARLTHRWKGWLLTALAATVLLAASAGTALAQITDIQVRSVRIDDANAAGEVAEGITSNVTVTLNKAVPVGDTVTVTIAEAYASGAAGEPGNAEADEIVVSTTVIIPGGSSSGSTPIIFGLDSDAVDERFLINATAIAIDSNATPANAVVDTNLPIGTPSSGKIVDAQEQTYTLRSTAVASTIREGGVSVAFSLRAVPARPTGEPVTIHLAAPRGYAIGGVDTPAASGQPANTVLDDSTPATGEAITLTTPTNDENRTDDVVALTAHLGTPVRSTQVAMTEVTVLDIHQLPASDAITADARDNERRDLGTAIDSVMEGDTAYVWVAIINTAQDRVDDAEQFTVDVTGADPSQSLDYRITRPEGNRRTSGSARGTDRLGPWVIEIYEDEDVGAENLMLSLDVNGARANGGGSTSGSFSLGIVDNTERKVWPLPEAEAYPAITDARDAAAGDDGLNPGESFTVMTSNLFGLMDGYTAAYAASVEGGAVSVSASGDSITVNAVAAGESTVTVTATARMAASAFQAEQTVSNVASITFPVTVVEIEVPEPSQNVIEPKAQDEAYPVILGAIEAAEGDEGLNPGESFELAAGDLFTVMGGYTAAYAVTVDGSAVSASASGDDTVSVTAEMAGEATVTITGTARAAASSFESSQTSTHTAEVKFPVTVVDKALMLTWYVGQGGDDYNVENLVEGQEYEIIVNANRAISEAEGSVEVTFMRDRAASDADDSDYTVGVATLRAGRDHAHVRPPLMVLADDISEGGTDDGGNVGEQLVLFGVASNGAPVMPDPEHFSTDNGALTIWDTAVPALPVIATWLLGLGLLGGGARQMYLRRRQD